LKPLYNPNIIWNRQSTITDYDDATCVSEFRFRKQDLVELAALLWPKFKQHLDGDKGTIRCLNRYVCHYETGLLIILYCLSRPRRLRPDMEQFFGMRLTHLSSVIATFMTAMHDIAVPYFTNPFVWHERMPYYAALVQTKSNNACSNVWGFIDGTLRKTCRPSLFQKLAYSGHKRSHGIKFQSVVAPDGFIVDLFGPIPGSRHDSFMLGQSELLHKLRELMPEGSPLYSLYGDPAYPQSAYIFGAHRNAQAGSPEARWNTQMSKVRESVEWGFKEIVAQWAFLDFKASMMIFKMPVGQYFIVAAFLTNLRNCLYGGQVSSYFNAQVLSLQDYLNLLVDE
jgi:hypothetical protein